MPPTEPPKSLRERVALGVFDPKKEDPLDLQTFLTQEMEGFDRCVDTYQNLEAEKERRKARAKEAYRAACTRRERERGAFREAFMKACFEDCEMSLEDRGAIKAWEMAKDRGCSKLEILDHFQELADLIKTARCPL